MSDFQENLLKGKEWEIKVSTWLQENAHYVMEVYDYNIDAKGEGKTPKLKVLPTEDSLILPDLQVAANGVTHWIEVKSKSSVGKPFSNNQHYRTTGIDLKYWQHYLKVSEVTGLPVHIYFVHYNEGEIRAASLVDLHAHEQKFEKQNCSYGKGGMVFWNYDKLKKIADIDLNGNICTNN